MCPWPLSCLAMQLGADVKVCLQLLSVSEQEKAQAVLQYREEAGKFVPNLLQQLMDKLLKRSPEVVTKALLSLEKVSGQLPMVAE